MNKNRWITALLILFITVFGIHTLYLNTDGMRTDLTETGLYTLTQGTHDILAKMNQDGVQPIGIKLYFSSENGKKLPQFIKQFITYHDYVKNLLKEYERSSNGKISLSFIDPKTDSDEAQDANDYGLMGHQLNQQGDQFFFGLVFETQTGSKDIIDFLWPEKQDSIEYEISKHIYNLLWPTKKRVGVMSSLEVVNDDSNPYYRQLLQAQGKQPQDPWASFEMLGETAEVKPIDKEADHIDKADFDLVVVVHPKSLSEKQLWALDEWVVTGGNTLVFVDPYSINDQAPQNPNQPFAQYQYKPASSLEKLLNTWGLTQPEDTFAVDYSLATKRPPGRNMPAEKILVDLSVDEASRNQVFDTESPIFQGLNNVRFFMAGTLKEQGEANWDRKVLVKTTDQGSTLVMKPGFPGGAELSLMDVGQPSKLLDHYTPTGVQALAYEIHGQLPSAFPQGAKFPESTPETPPGMPPGFQMPPDENATMVEKPAVADDQKAPATVIVFADSDFISDPLSVQSSFFGKMAVGDNAKVLLNCVDYLLGSKELMNVRSKKNLRRPFVLFDEIEAQADAATLDKEKEYRAEVENFQKQYQDKVSQLNQKNAALLEKKVRDELAQLQTKKGEAERKLREIRKERREKITAEEFVVWVSAMGVMPFCVLALGLFLFYRRRYRATAAQGGSK
ncbi:MAG: Gldg family protein [Acidobacteria bacterium]|nr:Gldg family protein [Acidobacteriota bacterium]